MYSEGRIVSIQIAPRGEGEMVRVGEIRAVPGRGLEGDRYFSRTGTYSATPGTGREVTLIEAEAVEALERDYGIKLDPKDCRRNIVTRGVALNHLVGREFQAGEVRLRAMRLCEPCTHLDKLVGKKVSPALVHRGGLRAEILAEGTLRVGDPIEANRAGI